MKKTVSQIEIYSPNKIPSAVFTEDYTTSTKKLTSNGHGLSKGDIVKLTVTTEEGDALPTGLSEAKVYYVQNPDTNTFELSETIDGASVEFSDNGQGTFTYWLKGKVIFVADFVDVVLAMHTKDNASLTFKIYGSIAESMPNFFLAKDEDNIWDTVQVKDLEDNAGVDGDTGITIAGTDDVKQFAVNTAGLNYLTAEITSFTAGKLGLSASCYEAE